MNGRVTLVGGGPGDPGLITVSGLAALMAAEVVLYDHLAPLSLLEECAPGTLLIDVGKIPGGRATPQDEINRLLVEHALAGREVVRFKGGDGFVFGRGGEEWLACAEAGIEVRVIPGVTSAIGGPALADIAVSHRGLIQGFTVVSGHVGPDHPASTTNWEALAASGTTLVILMGVRTLGEICRGLIDRGLDPATPAAVIASAGSPSMRVIRGTAATIATLAEKVRPPAITVIGAVAALALADAQPGPGA
ncbi:MAG: uroporphyrinogen-III C-methyltransferase [Micropruina sp.]|nr:uroporphyrinogen-III C-methyltransferase [Micropruina sp.]